MILDSENRARDVAKNICHAICLLALSIFLVCLPVSSDAAKDDYQTLVERNLELRDQLEALEQKYAQLENERNVLISHVRNLQLEKEKNAQGKDPKEENTSLKLQKLLDEANDKLIFIAQEKDQLKKELDDTRETILENESKVQVLESEKLRLNKQVEELSAEIVVLKENQLKQEELKILKLQNYTLNKELAGVVEKFEKSKSSQKDLAIETAFLRAQESELTARNSAILAQCDQLKGDFQRLAKINESLAQEQKKWEQSKRELDDSRADSRKKQTQLTRMKADLDEAQKKLQAMAQLKKDLKAQQNLQKEHQILIRKLTVEKSNLEIKLLKQKKTGKALTASWKQELPPAKKQLLDMHFNLAVAYDKTEMYKAEEREYLECLKIDPNDSSVHYNLGILYDDKLGSNPKAVKHYTKYLELMPFGEETEQVKHWIMLAEQEDRINEHKH